MEPSKSVSSMAQPCSGYTLIGRSSGRLSNRLEPRCAHSALTPARSKSKAAHTFIFTQRPAELDPLLRLPRTYPHIDGTLEHTSSSFHRRIFHTVMHTLC